MDNAKMAVILLGGGTSRRFGCLKQYTSILGKPLFIHTIKSFINFPVVLVMPENTHLLARENLNYFKISNKVYLVKEGSSRQESVKNGLSYLCNSAINKVIISEVARPCLTKQTIKDFSQKLKNESCLLAVTKSTNTTCFEIEGKLDKLVPRKNMYDLLMPQGFDFNKIYAAHCNTKINNATDDSVLFLEKHLSNQISLFSISKHEGFKVTYPSDALIVEKLLEAK